MKQKEDPPARPIAVALAGREPLPRVVATGYGETARQILELAFANGVKVREDADLAEILVALDLGADVPLEALHVVSEILARVYAANTRASDPPPASDPAV